MSGSFILREAKERDIEFLKKMLYEAIFIPDGADRPPFSIINSPEIIKYTDGWMKGTDAGFIAEASHRRIGAVWTRLFDEDSGGYGFISDSLPELAIAVLPAYQNRGIGKNLLLRIFAHLKDNGYSGVSLSVDKRNKQAVHLYEKVGFEIFRNQETDFVMIMRFEKGL